MIADLSTSPPAVVPRSKLVTKRFTAVDRGSLPGVTALPVFDFVAFFAAFDAERRDRGLGWYDLADEL